MFRGTIEGAAEANGGFRFKGFGVSGTIVEVDDEDKDDSDEEQGENDEGIQLLLRSEVRRGQATSPKTRCEGLGVNGRGFRGALDQAVDQKDQENQTQELEGIQSGSIDRRKGHTRVVLRMTTYEAVAPTSSWAVYQPSMQARPICEYSKLQH